MSLYKQGGDKFVTYSQIPHEYNASFYYRVMLPFATMEKLGLPVFPIIDRNDADIPFEQRIQGFCHSDFTQIYQGINPYYLRFMKMLRQAKAIETDQGRVLPPTFVLDSDDDIFNVSPLNSAFSHLGFKAPNGKDMEPGDKISITDFVTGEPVTLWEDGVNNFNLAQNKERLDTYKQMLEQANLVTCSTPRVEDYIRREVPNANTYVHYNCIDFKEYPKIELAEHPNEVRILWQGSPTHHEDFWFLRHAIGRIGKKYPHVKWIIWGAKYEWIAQDLDASTVQFEPWIPYPAYKIRLGTYNHDINLAPLDPHIFNQSRSAIKWYESSAISKPAATLAQNTAAYRDEMEDGKTGLLFNNADEFEEKLCTLIENATLRQTLASNAKDWLHTNRNCYNLVPKLWEKYMEVRNGMYASLPIAEPTETFAPTPDPEVASEPVPN